MNSKIIVLAFLGSVAVVGFGIFGKALSVHDNAIAAEEGAKAAWKNMMNVRDNAYQQITGAASVANAERESFNEIFQAAQEGRYGDGGSQAMMQWITEQNPNPTPDLFKKVQSIMEARLNEWTTAQAVMTDHQRSYATYTQTAVNAMFAGFWDFPREVKGQLAPPSDLDGDGILTVLDYPVIVTAHTQQEFSSGTAEVIDPFAGK